MGRLRDQVSKLQLTLAAAASICYAVGYPLGVVARSAVGWILVTTGGAFLAGLGIVTVRRIHAQSASSATAPSTHPDSATREQSRE